MLCSVVFFSSTTGATALENPSPHAVLAISAAPVELTQHVGSDVTFSLTRNGKPLTNTKLHVVDNPAFSHMPTGPQRTNHRGMLVMPDLTAQSSGPQTIEISALGQSLRVQFTVSPAPTASATAAEKSSPLWPGSSDLPYASEASPTASTAPTASPASASSVVSGPPSRAGFSSGTASSGAPPKPLSQTLFNTTASFLGVPGLVSPVDGLRDEGLGFHADGTTRKAGGADATGGGSLSGQRAAAYASSAWTLGRQDWLYDDIMGIRRDADGRALYFGSEHAGRREGRGTGQNLFGDNFSNSLFQRGLSAGMGFANTRVESAILGLMGSDSPYGNGKARLNFMWHLDDKGKSRLGGEGDVLWPLYDSLHTTLFTQIGARSMFGGGDEYGPDRWIGNIGVGQRWFPGARLDADGKVDSGNWMLGYNAFYDHDLSRGHQRGGVGVEAQYDWLKVASNWYAPLSSWKDSTDFDGNYVRERAAQGWDVRAKGYVPFYREVAVTGSFTQWYGDYVGMFGPGQLEKSPKVWAYGLEYTPVPAMTAYVNQRQSEQGRSDTEFGLRFTYHFGMDAEDQFTPSRVAEMRTVHGSRHDFVDRENKIILEYQTKESLYIDFVSYADNTFIFRVRDGFNKNKPGQAVEVTLRGTATLAAAPVQPEAKKGFFAEMLNNLRGLLASVLTVSPARADSGRQYITDAGGLFYVRVDDPNKLTQLRVSAGDAVRVYDRPALTLPPAPEMTLTADATSLPSGTTTSLTLTNAPANSPVTWKVEGAGGSVTGGDKTNAEGKATATFTASSMGKATITATVDTVHAPLELTITAAAYMLEASPATLRQNTPAAVTFTVKKNGTAVPANTAVTFTANANFTNLPSTEQTTNASGQIVASTLTAINAGAQTVEITVDGQKASVAFTVEEDGYSLAVNPTTLTLNTPTAVRFTVLRNGEPLPAGIELTFSALAALPKLPSGPQRGNGIYDIADFTATAAGTHTITVTAHDGKTATCSLTAVTARYSVTSSHSALVQHRPESVSFTVTKDGSPAPNTSSVTFTDSSASFSGLPTTPQTLSGGQVVVSGLTGIKAGTPTLQLTVDGQDVPLGMSVTPAAWSVEADHDSLTQHTGQDLTLTVKQNGKAVGAGVVVTFAADSDNFHNLPSSLNTNANGQVTLPKLAALTTGLQRITGSVNGQSFTLPMQVQAVGYTVQASHSALTQHVAQSVTFTVMRGGKAAPAGLPVSFAAHAAFPALDSAEKTTNANGQITVTDLTATTAGAHTLQATVARQAVPHAVPLSVSPASYSLSASPASITAGNPATVAFTVLRNGVALTTSDKVRFSSNPALNLPTGEQTVLSGGKIEVTNLKATASGSQTVEVTVNTSEGKAQTSLAVGNAIYSLSASAASLTQHTPQSVTFTVKQGGVAVPAGTLVVFTPSAAWANLPGNATPTTASGEITLNTLTALASGQQTVEITVGGQKTSVSLGVTPVTYGLDVSPTALPQHEPTNVTFTFTRGGTPLSQVTPVSFAGNSQFLNLPGRVNTAADGTVSVPGLITTAASAQTVTAMVDGQTVSTSLGVTPAVYTVTASPAALIQNRATTVNVTVQRGGKAVGAGIPVRFSGNAHFINLPTGELKTNASGQVALPGLVTTAPTNQSLAATVAGQAISVDFSVTPATYTVAANPSSLIQHKATDVVFTVMQDGKPARAGLSVTFDANAHFSNLPGAAQSTNADGQIVVPGLVATASGGQSLSLTADGQNLAQSFGVTPALYVLTPNLSVLTQGTAQQVIFTLTRNGQPAPEGVALAFTPNANISGLPATANTDAAGQVSATLTALNRDRLTLDASVDNQRLSTALGVNGKTFTVSVKPAALTQYKAENVNLTVSGWGGASNTLAIVPNTAFANLPASVDVGAAGTAGTLPNLTATATGSHVLEFVHPVDGSRAYASLAVTAPEYKLDASHASPLVKDKATSVTLTLTRGGEPLPSTVPVTLSGAAFTGLPTAPVNTGGSIAYTLTPTAEGRHTITAMAEGVSFDTALSVGAAEYALTLVADPTAIKTFEHSTLTATVTKNGQPAPDGTVVNWSVVSGSGVFTSGEGTEPTARTSTTSGGKASVTLQGTAAGAVALQASTGTGSGAGTGTANVTVTEAEYILTASQKTLTQYKPQDVVFTLTRNGSPLANTAVTLNGAGFEGLPPSPTTSALGQITVPGLTATVADDQTVEVTVNGQKATENFTVTAATHDLKASTTELVHHMGQDVILTLTRNGVALGNTSVSFSGDFGALASQTTNASGQITLTGLTATEKKLHTLTAKVAGVTPAFDLKFTVNPAVYLMTATPLTLIQHKGQNVVFTVTRNGVPLANSAVNLASTDFASLPSPPTTNASGQFTLTGLTATDVKPHTLTATVTEAGASSPFPFTFTVSAATYTLSANTTTLTVDRPTAVRFTLTRNDDPLPAGTAMTFSVEPADSVINLPSGTVGNGGIMAAPTLTAKAASSPKIIATTKDGKTASVDMTVVAARYSATSSHSAVMQNQPVSVIFTVKKDGSPVPVNTSVSFADDSASFKELPVTKQALNGGQVLVSLTGITAGSPTLKLTVDGQEINVGMTISPAVYSVEASHATLTQHTGEVLTLTVKKNGNTVGKDVEVHITPDSDNFYNLPTSLDTNASGQVLPKLTALSTGLLSLKGTAGSVGGVGGTSFSLPLQVHAVGYAVQASHATLTLHKAEDVTFTVMQGGKALAGVPVRFAAHEAFPALDITEQTTNASGQVTLTKLTATKAGAHNVQVTVARQATPHAVPLSVAPARYSLSANPASITAGSPATVAFTVLRNGDPLPSGDKVTFTSNPALSLPTGDQTVGSGGKLELTNLTATASGSQTVEVSVNADGGKAQTSLAVSNATYSLGASAASLTQHTPTSVTFTVTQGGNPVPAGTLVVFTPNAAWANLPGSATPTIANGQIVVPTLTALASGQQAVEITVGGQKTSASLDVTPVNYALEVYPAALTQHEPKDVTFTFSRGGWVLSQETAVTFDANSNFLNLPGSVTTKANGTVSVPGLITTAASAQTVTASVDGQTVSARMPVTAAHYTFMVEPLFLIQNRAADVTLTVKRGTTIVGAGVPVRFSANAQFQNVPTGELKTNEYGKIFVPGLVITAPTGQSLAATVAGQKTSADLGVTPAVYKLTVSPASLTQHKPADVVFTLMQDGTPVRAGLPVTFAKNAKFSPLPTEELKTDANGQILVRGLTSTASTEQSIALTVEGKSVMQNIRVTPALYALTPDQSVLTQGTAQPVIFTLMRNGQIAPEGIALSFTPNANITGLPDTASTNGAGQIAATLTALTRDKLTLDTHVDEQRVSTPLGVNGTDFTVGVNPAALTQHRAEKVNITTPGWGKLMYIELVSNNAFQNLPGYFTVDAAGKGTLPNLTATATGAQVLEFVHPVDGSRAFASFMVSAPEYTISASPAAPATSLVKDKATSVTFTLTRDGKPFPYNVPVTFSGANFKGLPLNAVSIPSGDGKTTFTLTPTAEGSHTITATAEGVSFSTELTVGAAEYALTLAAVPDTIKTFASSTLTATVTKNGQQAPDGTVVKWSVVSGPGVFTSGEDSLARMATASSSTRYGKASVTMQGTAAGTVQVQASAGSGAGAGSSTGSVTVEKTAYALSASQNALVQHKPQDVVLTLTRNGAALANSSVTLSGTGFSGTGFASLPQTRTTSALGQISLPGLTATGDASPLTLTATVNPAGGGADEGSASTDFTVTAASHDLAASTAELVHHMGQDVILTLTRNGVALGNTSVSFSGDFGALASQTTNASGQLTLPGLTATEKKLHTLTAKVDGVTTAFDLKFTVKDAVYLMTATPQTLKQHKGQDVVFTLMRNGVAAPAGVAVTFSVNPNFNLPGSETTKAGGLIEVSNLIATGTNSQTVEITVEGQKATASFNVTPADYALTADTTELKQHEGKKVTFTLTADGVAAPAGVSVTFIDNADITGLPTTAQTTTAGGIISVSTITAETSGDQTVEITVEGQKPKASFNVTAASYGLTATPTELPFNKATLVTFTLNRNDAAAPSGVSVTLSGPSDLTISPTSATTLDGGTFTATLKGMSTGGKTVTATVDGQTANASLTVKALPDGLTLAASSANPGESASSTLTATLVIGGMPASGKTVTFKWIVKGTTKQQGSGTAITDANGVATYTLSGTGDRRTLTVTATAEGKSDSKDVQFGAALPSGFIVLAGALKNWADADTYCVAQGGKLPRINRSPSWDGKGFSTLDGFGTGIWPSDLPVGNYWTGTGFSGDTTRAWNVGDNGGYVSVRNVSKNNIYRVACVP